MLTPEQANKVLSADLANLVNKVKEGKTLTANERKVLTELDDLASDAKNISHLSKLLGVSRQSIYNWQNDDEAPKTLNIRDWENFIASRESQKGKGSGRVNVGGKHWTAQEILDLKALETQERHKRMIAERKLKEFELKKVEQGWVEISDAKKVITEVVTTVQRLLENLPKRFASRVNPNNPDRAEQILTDIANETLNALKNERRKNL